VGGLRIAADILTGLLRGLQRSPWSEVGTWFLSLVFLWSGLAKLRRPRLAALAMSDFGVLPRPRLWHGLALAGAEILLGVALASGFVTRASLAASFGLFLVFSLMILRTLVGGRRFPCFCFGADDHMVSLRTLMRTAALAGLASVLLVAPSQAVERHLPGFATYFELLLAMAGLGVLTLGTQIVPLLRWNRETARHFRLDQLMGDADA
jgi:uncharacterized membrane protein YphA (DoxX/SURF4 family)